MNSIMNYTFFMGVVVGMFFYGLFNYIVDELYKKYKENKK